MFSVFSGGVLRVFSVIDMIYGYVVCFMNQ